MSDDETDEILRQRGEFLADQVETTHRRLVRLWEEKHGKSATRQRIAELAPGYDPRHVEAFLRAQEVRLDAPDDPYFLASVTLAMRDIDREGLNFAESLAQRLGL